MPMLTYRLPCYTDQPVPFNINPTTADGSQPEVFNTVIVRDAVKVCDHLFGGQFSTQVLLHHVTVFKDLGTVHGYELVPVSFI